MYVPNIVFANNLFEKILTHFFHSFIQSILSVIFLLAYFVIMVTIIYNTGMAAKGYFARNHLYIFWFRTRNFIPK